MVNVSDIEKWNNWKGLPGIDGDMTSNTCTFRLLVNFTHSDFLISRLLMSEIHNKDSRNQLSP